MKQGVMLLGFAALAVAPDTGLAQGTRDAGKTIVLERRTDVEAFQAMDFSTVNDIEWVGDTAIALIDVHGAEVVIEHVTTGTRRTIGRRGEGPGELLYPVAMGVQSAGSILLVADSKAQRISLFDLDTGEFRKSQPIRGMPLSVHGLRDSVAVVTLSPFMGGGPTLAAIDLRSGEFTPRFSYFEVDDQLAAATRSGSRFLAVLGAAEGPFYAAAFSEYRIVVLDPAGNRLRSFGRPELEPRRPTKQDVARQRQTLIEAMSSTGVTPPPGLIAEQLERYREQPLPFFTRTGLATDGAGNLWVIRAPGGADSTDIDVFGSDGRLRQSLRVRDRVEAMSIRDSLAVLLVQRASGPWSDLESIDVYHIR